MKTAEEMAIFCKENNTGSGMGKKWTLKHFTVVENQLNDDEEVLFAFVGLYNYISMSKHQNNFAIAITNDRIIAGQKKLMGENVNTISRRNLNDISKSTGMMMGVLTVDTLKETFNIGTNKQEIDTIYEGLNRILFEQRDTSTQDTPTSENEPIQSSVAQLKEYKELLDLEIITQEEFDAKKNEILG